MKLSIGIVGLPNVGKSTLFNALLKKSPFAKASEGQAGGAKIANYPFTTIDPNIGVVEVPDERLPVLAKIVSTEKIIPAVVEFYDIAGLVRGASKGEGLGNKFLSYIREVSAIVHVVRLFEDSNVIHVNNKVSPADDMKIIEEELILADLETLTKSSSTKAEKSTEAVTNRLMEQLNKGVLARNIGLTDEERDSIKHFNLLTLKPMIYVFNVSEQQLENINETKNQIAKFDNYIILNAKLENDVLTLSEQEQKEYLNQFHLEDTGLDRLIKKSYEVLGLISFLTAGIKEVRAWTITKGMLAPQAAGVIHSDFEKHFIKADIISYGEFVNIGGWVGAREQGKVQIVGRDYEMKDDDVVEFKVGV